MGRPRAADPRTYRHFTNLTKAEEDAWVSALRRLTGDSPLKPRDSDAVRLGMKMLVESTGTRWPEEEEEEVPMAVAPAPTPATAGTPAKAPPGESGSGARRRGPASTSAKTRIK